MSYYIYILAALTLDCLFGDPRWYPHPVKWIGLICRMSETLTRKIFNNQFVAGTITVIAVLLLTVSSIYLLLSGAYSLSLLTGEIVAVLLLYTAFAAKDLIRHSVDVYNRLVIDQDLPGARKAVARIVGRETESLDDSGVSKACIETVAENMVDGITAPLFFAVIFSLFSPYVEMSGIGCSAVGAFFYKAVNTMDSMIGYKNEKYLYFGRTAAKLDDLVNIIPARISGFMLIFAAFLLKLDYRGALEIFSRDRLNHASPNAGHTEAAVAGALGIRLGGPSIYFGALVEKPFLGDDKRPIRGDDIKAANGMVIVGSLLFVTISLVLRFFITF